MTTNYDPIAEQYKRSKQQPWRTYIEAVTLMGLIGDLSEKSVIDIACGEGFYTRMLRQRGAKKVTGVDLSEGMIALARANEAQHQLGIEYVVGDGRALDLGTEYDLAVAAYLLQTVWKDGLCGFRCRIWRDRIGHDTHFWIRTFANLVVAGGGGRLRWRRQSGAVHRRLCR